MPTWRAGRPRQGAKAAGLIDAFMRDFAEYYDRDGSEP